MEVGAAVEAGGEAGAVGRDEEARAGFAHELEEEVEDRVRRRLVEVAGRLVGEDEPGPMGERPADGDALLLAAGELLGIAPAEAVEAEAGGERGLPVGVEAAGEAGLEGEVGGDVEARDQIELLEDEADPVAAERGAGGVGGAGDQRLADADRAGVGGVEAGDEVEKGALAAPDSPVRARLSPGASARETPRRTGTGPSPLG